MPTVHPQLQRARSLLPLIAAASDEHDAVRKTHPSRSQSPDRWWVLHHAEDEIRWRNGVETLDLRPGVRNCCEPWSD